MKKNKFSFAAILLFTFALVSLELPAKTGDWTSSGAPLAPSMPAEPSRPVLKCRDSSKRNYLIEASVSKDSIREFKRGEFEKLSGTLNIVNNNTTEVFSVILSKDMRDRNLYRLDLQEFEYKRLKKADSIPTALYFRSGIGTQKLTMLLKTKNSYEYLDLRCHATWFFIL